MEIKTEEVIEILNKISKQTWYNFKFENLDITMEWKNILFQGNKSK